MSKSWRLGFYGDDLIGMTVYEDKYLMILMSTDKINKIEYFEIVDDTLDSNYLEKIINK